jgi:hypothetical protein
MLGEFRREPNVGLECSGRRDDEVNAAPRRAGTIVDGRCGVPKLMRLRIDVRRVRVVLID